MQGLLPSHLTAELQTCPLCTRKLMGLGNVLYLALERHLQSNMGYPCFKLVPEPHELPTRGLGFRCPPLGQSKTGSQKSAMHAESNKNLLR